MLETSNKKTGKVAWKSPSNIAIVKYWGKYGIQLPMNPSISFTLSEAHTITEMSYEPKEKKDNEITLEYFFENKQNKAFEEKVKKYLSSLLVELPFLTRYQFSIKSKNSFPHSAGIASSASSMSALALCLMSLSQVLDDKKYSDTEFWPKASHFARLGSGSASRSLYSHAALWGETPEFSESSQEYAISLSDSLHPEFKTLQDSILIIDDNEKKVSSRAGHALMNKHPYKESRIKQAQNHLTELTGCLKTGNWEKFIEITENEALSLHALMMSSKPWYSLLKPGTLKVMESIRSYREKTQIPVCFTLDAGPNVHILYPKKYNSEIKEFIEKDLIIFAAAKRVIHDHVGEKPMAII